MFFGAFGTASAMTMTVGRGLLLLLASKAGSIFAFILGGVVTVLALTLTGAGGPRATALTATVDLDALS